MYLIPKCFLSTVGTIGAQERLTLSSAKVFAVTLSAERSNTGVVYVGDSEVSSTNYGADLSAGDSITISAEELGWANAKISLRDIWLDVSATGDGVGVMYLERG